MLEEIKKKYANGALECPSRHYLNRFVKDLHNWHEKYCDHMHYTVPLKTGKSDNYEFPSEYIG